MALTAPQQKQISFARQVAWERGKRLATIPATSSALSGVIQHLLASPPLDITDSQVETVRRLNAECVAKVDGFTPIEELPGDRAAANRLIYSMRRRLSAVEFRAAQADADSYLVDAGTPVEADETVVDDPAVPF